MGLKSTITANATVKGPLTPFNEVLTAEKSPLIELKSVYGLSALRDVQTVAGSGAITNTSSEYVLSTGTTASSSAILDSAERGRYLPGHSAEAGIAVRIPSAPTGSQAGRWGYFDTQDGFYFGYDASGKFVAYMRNSSETKVYQSSWNADKLDGTGASGLTLTVSDGVIYQIRYTWYGYGTIEWIVTLRDSNNVQYSVVVHRYAPTATTSVLDPNLPIRAKVENGATTSDFTMYVAGRKYHILGRYAPNRRITSDFRLSLASVGTTFLPLITLRRKSAFDSASVKVEGYDIISTADLVVQVRLNATLTGASYGAPQNTTAGETAVESDIAATAVSGGELLWEGLVTTTGTGSNAKGFGRESEFDFDFIGVQPVTLCARAISGTGTVSSVFRVREEW